MSRITINGVYLDPAAPKLQQASLLAADAVSSPYVLVQVKGPLSAGQKKQLEDLGLALLEYVPEDTYVCHSNGTALASIRALSFVAWANSYMKGFKIPPSLHAAAEETRADLLDLHDAPVASPRSRSRVVDIVLHRNIDPKSVAQKIGHAAGIDPADLRAARGKFRMRVQADRLAALASLDEVRHIEPVFEKQLWNNVARQLLGADKVQIGANLEGAGQIVAVCDTGLDTGDPTNLHAAFAGRVLKLYALGRPNASDPDGHGTHVCGSVLGDGVSSVYGPIRGTAPKAQLIMQSVLDPQGGLGGLPDDLHQLFQPTYGDGARVHSNSWGAPDNAYTAECHDVDAFVHKHRDFVVVIAAGNAGTDQDGDGVIDLHSVGSPGTARNCITVGASENDRPGFAYVEGNFKIHTYGQGWPNDFPVAPVNGDRLANNAAGLAAFSSRGPTADGRIKPDVVAPGTGILSTRSRAPGAGNGWGPSQDPNFFFEGGTSMATPLVAGCAAVVREYLINKGLPHPSAALIKAMLINGADTLPGQYTPSETGTVPNVHQGFGRVNLAATVDDDPQVQLLELWDEDTALGTGEDETFTITLANPVGMLKVTLVWTDAPGETLQNDLDLTVTAGGHTRLGNAVPGSTVPDRKNNVEQVTMATVPAGTVTINVKAFRAAMHPQSFALVVRAT
jgi:subtilisin family serine protease